MADSRLNGCHCLWKYSGIITVLLVFLVTSIAIVAVIFSDDVKLQFMSRQDWGAEAPSEPLTPMNITPSPYVVICHTATEFCSSQADCKITVRHIQMFHKDSMKWDDIGYSFLVGGDGFVYEGRGWDMVGAHTIGFNYNSIGIAFIGTFTIQHPTSVQLRLTEKLIRYGIEKNKIARDYKLIGARQVYSTESPGGNLYNIIKTWSHWVPLS